MLNIYDRVFERDNYECVYCGKDLLTDIDAAMTVEADHIIPRAIGGHVESNMAACCPSCNRLKGNFLLPGYEAMDRLSRIDGYRDYISAHRRRSNSWFTQLRRRFR